MDKPESDYYATDGKYKCITFDNFNYKESDFNDDTQKDDAITPT